MDINSNIKNKDIPNEPPPLLGVGGAGGVIGAVVIVTETVA